MSRTLWQVVGMILLVVGGQGTVRILVDHNDAGLLGWVPGGFAVQLGCQIAVTLAGVLLAGWASRRTEVSDPEQSHR